MPKRFTDDFARLTQFSDEVLVRCPTCRECALLRRFERPFRPGEKSKALYEYSLSCTKCGLSKSTSQSGSGWLDETELWLQTPCCGSVLWVYNEKHLNWLDAYISADLRERRRSNEWGWSNQSMASRLPQWMQSSKNRDKVLAGLSRLRQMIV